MGFLCLHIRRFLCYTAKNSKICLIQFCCFNLSPRGDGNERTPLHDAPGKSFNLSPRGDGNHIKRYHAMPSFHQGFNLSPRGDGNHMLDRYGRRWIAFQLIPARGRKHDNLCRAPLRSWFQLIPARGRKQTAKCMDCPWNQVATYPREGTETVQRLRRSFRAMVATYPREGTETFSLLRLPCSFCWLQLIPARGRKRIPVIMFPTVKRCNLSPRGDGNCSASSFVR